MARRPSIMSTHEHHKHIKLIFDMIKKYGVCPLAEAEIAKANLINNCLIKKVEDKKAARRKV